MTTPNKGKSDFIVFDHVTKIYRTGETEIQALAGTSFTIGEGELVIVAGPSGAGKSTVLNILGGMDKLTEGTVTVDGRDISAYGDKQLTLYRRDDIGFVFQFYNLIPNLSARENVELAAYTVAEPLEIDQLMHDVGLQDRMDNFPSQLSGGEQQRVAIARAMAKNPKLLLCDEPTGALDYETSRSILKLLQQTCHTTGKTVVIIPHNLALTPMVDRVIRIKNGLAEEVLLQPDPQPVESLEW